VSTCLGFSLTLDCLLQHHGGRNVFESPGLVRIGSSGDAWCADAVKRIFPIYLYGMRALDPSVYRIIVAYHVIGPSALMYNSSRTRTTYSRSW
jgi:hypothetical protein